MNLTEPAAGENAVSPLGEGCRQALLQVCALTRRRDPVLAGVQPHLAGLAGARRAGEAPAAKPWAAACAVALAASSEFIYSVAAAGYGSTRNKVLFDALPRLVALAGNLEAGRVAGWPKWKSALNAEALQGVVEDHRLHNLLNDERLRERLGRLPEHDWVAEAWRAVRRGAAMEPEALAGACRWLEAQRSHWPEAMAKVEPGHSEAFRQQGWTWAVASCVTARCLSYGTRLETRTPEAALERLLGGLSTEDAMLALLTGVSHGFLASRATEPGLRGMMRHTCTEHLRQQAPEVLVRGLEGLATRFAGRGEACFIMADGNGSVDGRGAVERSAEASDALLEAIARTALDWDSGTLEQQGGRVVEAAAAVAWTCREHLDGCGAKGDGGTAFFAAEELQQMETGARDIIKHVQARKAQLALGAASGRGVRRRG